MKRTSFVIAILLIVGCTEKPPIERNLLRPLPNSLQAVSIAGLGTRPTEILPPARKIQALEPADMDIAATRFARAFSELRDPESVHTPEELAKADRKQEPRRKSIRHSSLEEFRHLSTLAVGGGPGGEGQSPVWIAEYEGLFVPETKGLTRSGKSATHLILGFSDQGELKYKIEMDDKGFADFSSRRGGQ